VAEEEKVPPVASPSEPGGPAWLTTLKKDKTQETSRKYQVFIETWLKWMKQHMITDFEGNVESFLDMYAAGHF